MIESMGIPRTTIEIAPLHDAEARRTLSDVMVDTGSEYSWAPAPLLLELGVKPVRTDRFETADGRILEREVGFALFFNDAWRVRAFALTRHAGLVDRKRNSELVHLQRPALHE